MGLKRIPTIDCIWTAHTHTNLHKHKHNYTKQWLSTNRNIHEEDREVCTLKREMNYVASETPHSSLLLYILSMDTYHRNNGMQYPCGVRFRSNNNNILWIWIPLRYFEPCEWYFRIHSIWRNGFIVELLWVGKQPEVVMPFPNRMQK